MALLASTSQGARILGNASPSAPQSSIWSSRGGVGPGRWQAPSSKRNHQSGERPRLTLVRAQAAAAADEGNAATATTTTAAPGMVEEVDKDTFWQLVEQAGDKVVVLDMYTQWCGPCKLILPQIMELSTKYDDVVFFKLDCNQHNKPLAKELGIRVVPTFKILKRNQIVAEVRGAKFQELVESIERARSMD